MRILIDTNIVYYLAGISSNKKFDVENFKSFLTSNNCELAISYFTFFEVLTKFDRKKDKQKLQKVLRFLSTNVHYFCYNQDSAICYNNIFEKCLRSNNKCKYYKSHLRSLIIQYSANFLAELCILLGGMYLYLIHYSHATPSEEVFQKSELCINSMFDDLFEQVETEFTAMYEKYYNSKEELCIRKELRTHTLYKVLEELFKAFSIVYRSYNELSIDELKNIKTFEQLKDSTRNDSSINFDDLKNKFALLRGNKHFEKEARKLFLSLYAHRTSDTRADVFEFISINLLDNHKFDFNDIVDYVNLIIPTITLDKDVYYLTTDKKWLQFLERNQSNTYYDTTLRYIKRFVSI